MWSTRHGGGGESRPSGAWTGHPAPSFSDTADEILDLWCRRGDLEADYVVADAAGDGAGGDGEDDGVGAGMKQGGVEREVALDPGGFDAVAVDGAAAAAEVGVGAYVFAVDGDAEGAGAGVGKAEAQGGFAGGGRVRRHGEVNSPGGGAALVLAGGLEVDVVGDLVDVPVLGGIGLADGEVDVVGEELGVFDVHAPVPVVVALEELLGGAVGCADLEDLLTVVDGMPLDGAEVESMLAGGDGDVGGGVIGAKDSIGDSVELVGAGADIGDGESAVGCAARPELVVLGVVLPGDALRLEGEARGTGCCGSCSGGTGRDVGAAVAALAVGEERVIGDGAVVGDGCGWGRGGR